jgi:hypothetical protein
MRTQLKTTGFFYVNCHKSAVLSLHVEHLQGGMGQINGPGIKDPSTSH